MYFFLYLHQLHGVEGKSLEREICRGTVTGLPSHNLTTGYAIDIFSDLRSSISSSLRKLGEPSALKLMDLLVIFSYSIDPWLHMCFQRAFSLLKLLEMARVSNVRAL